MYTEMQGGLWLWNDTHIQLDFTVQLKAPGSDDEGVTTKGVQYRLVVSVK
jgi:hypothetical protein